MISNKSSDQNCAPFCKLLGDTKTRYGKARLSRKKWALVTNCEMMWNVKQSKYIVYMIFIKSKEGS